MNSKTANIEELIKYDKNTLGYRYAKFMTKFNFSPDDRPLVKYMSNYELAYIK